MDNFVLYSVCIILGGAGAWLISRWGNVLGFLDNPNDRSSHEAPTPKGGGIGILAAFVIASLFLEVPLAFWFPATFLALFSFWSDRVEISPKFRLTVQFIAALAFLLPAYSLLPTPYFLLQSILWPLFSVLYLLFLSVFIVGTANYYNFMDPQITQIFADY